MTDKERKRVARKVVRMVIEDLQDRRGFRQTWDGCSASTKVEIRDTWSKLVEVVLAREVKT